MRKITFYMSLVTVVAFTCVCLMPTISHPQPPRSYPQRLYDVNTVKTISGTVKGITTGVLGKYKHPVVFVIVETTQNEKYKVSLGPVWYFEKQGFEIKEGDKVKVTGSDVTVDDKRVLLAAKVVKGNSILELRHSTGMPYWIGPGRL